MRYDVKVEREGDCEQRIFGGQKRWKLKWHTRKRPFKVSLRALSTALCVALRSAVFARLLGFRFGWVAGGPVGATWGEASTGGGRARVCTEFGEGD